jgi:hypothetical protein
MKNISNANNKIFSFRVLLEYILWLNCWVKQGYEAMIFCNTNKKVLVSI